jgi:hypothetical protein
LVNEGIACENKYGKLPTMLIKTHDRVTVKYASFLVTAISSVCLNVEKCNNNPILSEIADVQINGKYDSE